jgi:hypothetical protein
MNQFSDFSADAVTYIAAKTLIRLQRLVVVYGLATIDFQKLFNTRVMKS